MVAVRAINASVSLCGEWAEQRWVAEGDGGAPHRPRPRPCTCRGDHAVNGAPAAGAVPQHSLFKRLNGRCNMEELLSNERC